MIVGLGNDLIRVSRIERVAKSASTASAVAPARSPSSATYTFTLPPSSRKEYFSKERCGIAGGADAEGSVWSSCGVGLGAARSPVATLLCQ